MNSPYRKAADMEEPCQECARRNAEEKLKWVSFFRRLRLHAFIWVIGTIVVTAFIAGSSHVLDESEWLKIAVITADICVGLGVLIAIMSAWTVYNKEEHR